MKRRSFLEMFAKAAGLLAIPGAAMARTASRRIVLQTSAVAGFQYHRGEAVWPLLQEGDAVTLVREADNLYDELAVRVDWRGEKLGYVPRAENQAVANLLDGNLKLTAKIVELRKSSGPWERLRFAVYLET